MDRVQAKGLTIAYQLAGDGPPAVLLHGFSLDSRYPGDHKSRRSPPPLRSWRGTRPALASPRIRRRAIRLATGPLRWRLDATAIQHAHIVGISWGGLLA
jgi:pimeloyl-ACP methyl ester carboxylesterase